MELIQPKIYVTEFDVEECLKYASQLEEIVQLYGPEQPIVIHVESPGGSLTGFFIFMDALNSVQNPIYTYTTGIAASAGFALLVTGARNGGQRIVGENALLMVHGVQISLGEGLTDLKDADEIIRCCKVRNAQFLTPIAKSIGLKTLEELEELIKSKTKSHDLNLTSDEAKELGMVDVIGSLKLVPPIPTFGLNIFYNNIEDHRKVCQDPNCTCREDMPVPEMTKEAKKEVKKFFKKKRKGKK